MIVVMREALIKTVIRLVANATAKKILWGDNVPVANQISLDFPIVNSVIVHPLHGAMKKQVSFKKSKIDMGPIIYYVSKHRFMGPPMCTGLTSTKRFTNLHIGLLRSPG